MQITNKSAYQLTTSSPHQAFSLHVRKRRVMHVDHMRDALEIRGGGGIHVPQTIF